jgi:hypothetical protein
MQFDFQVLNRSLGKGSKRLSVGTLNVVAQIPGAVINDELRSWAPASIAHDKESGKIWAYLRRETVPIPGDEGGNWVGVRIQYRAEKQVALLKVWEPELLEVLFELNEKNVVTKVVIGFGHVGKEFSRYSYDTYGRLIFDPARNVKRWEGLIPLWLVGRPERVDIPRLVGEILTGPLNRIETVRQFFVQS